LKKRLKREKGKLPNEINVENRKEAFFSRSHGQNITEERKKVVEELGVIDFGLGMKRSF